MGEHMPQTQSGRVMGYAKSEEKNRRKGYRIILAKQPMARSGQEVTISCGLYC